MISWTLLITLAVLLVVDKVAKVLELLKLNLKGLKQGLNKLNGSQNISTQILVTFILFQFLTKPVQMLTIFNIYLQRFTSGSQLDSLEFQ